VSIRTKEAISPDADTVALITLACHIIILEPNLNPLDIYTKSVSAEVLIIPLVCFFFGQKKRLARHDYVQCAHDSLSIKSRVVGHSTSFGRDAHVLLNDANAHGQGFEAFGWTNVLIENGQWNGQSTDGVGNIDNSTNASFTGDAGQHQIHLFFRISKLGEVFDAVQDSSLVRNSCIWDISLVD
jgi:hypothetical protein